MVDISKLRSELEEKLDAIVDAIADDAVEQSFADLVFWLGNDDDGGQICVTACGTEKPLAEDGITDCYATRVPLLKIAAEFVNPYAGFGGPRSDEQIKDCLDRKAAFEALIVEIRQHYPTERGSK